ncbi:MAG: glycosyltransferase family 4 protein [Herpetosiphon sp.]
MRILHYNLTTTTKEGGIETFVWELSRQQSMQGHAVTIIGGTGHIERGGMGVRVLRYPFIDREQWARVALLRRHVELRKLLERWSMLPAALAGVIGARPEIVHLHKPYDLILAPIAHLLGAKVIYHGHGEDFYPGDRQLMQGVDALLSCSRYNADTLVQRYGDEPEIVYNGFDPTFFRPRRRDEALHRELASGAAFVALAAGRLQPWKGVQYAIAALQYLPPTTRFRLVVGGEGRYRTVLEQQVRELGLEEQVVFVGAIPHREIARFYGAADVVVGTSFNSETFGMTLCEALACGRPVIASDWAGYHEVVNEETGWIVPRRDPEALARAMSAVEQNRAEAARRAEAGRARVHALFTWAAVERRVQAVYDRVAASSRMGTT